MPEVETLEDMLDELEDGEYDGPETAECNPTQPLVLGDRSVVPNRQWSAHEGIYRPCGKTVLMIPPDAYSAEFDQHGLLLRKMSIVTDDLLILPDTVSSHILSSIQSFWSREERFRSKGVLFKRGVLLYGPPGSGKTATVIQLARDVIERGGIVLVAGYDNFGYTTHALTIIREVEPNRPIVCVIEDIDDVIKRYGEAQILSLLDGESQVDRIVYLATTNYPENLDGRLKNRPSRFDERVEIGMPSDDARRVFITARMGDDLTGEEVNRWVSDTKGLSISHIKELVTAVFCLGRDYEESVTRLKSMGKKVTSTSSGEALGFSSKTRLHDGH
jgi:hypothetical protein